MGYRETVSSGRYMKQAGKFMLKLVDEMGFWCCFGRVKTAFFLGKNCFSGGLRVVFVHVFAYGA